MTALFETMIEAIKTLWNRFMQGLEARNMQHVQAWGSALQYKRRYTNPDDAKRYRRAVEDVK